MTEYVPPAKTQIGDEERAAVNRVLRSRVTARRSAVATPEHKSCDHLGFRRPRVAVNSGTFGPHLALLAASVAPGEEPPVVPSFIFAATAKAVVLARAMHIFADNDPDIYCLSTASVEASVTERTAAEMSMHSYGHPADLTAPRGLAGQLSESTGTARRPFITAGSDGRVGSGSSAPT